MKKILPYLSKLVLIIGIFSLACASYLGIVFYKKNQVLSKKAQENAESTTHKVATTLSHYITPLRSMSIALAQKITQGSVKKEGMPKELQKKEAFITGMGALYLNETGTQLQGTYYIEKDDKQKEIALSLSVSDYSWISDALKGTSSFVGPVIDPETKQYVIVYATPFYKPTPLSKEKEVAGIVFATQSLAHLRHILFTLHVGDAGYWVISDNHNKVVLHPNKNQQNTIFLPSKELSNQQNEGIEDESVDTYISELTGKNSWVFDANIDPIDWKLWGVFDTSRIYDTKEIRKISIHFIICMTLFLLCLIVFCNIPISVYRLWIISALTSLVFGCSIIALWILENNFPKPDTTMLPVYSKSQLYTVLDELKETGSLESVLKRRKEKKELLPHDDSYYLKYRYKQDKYIPTGILTNDIEFSSPDRIEFVGYIWQRYFDGIHDGLQRGFILPQLGDSPDIKEVARVKEGKEETIIWLVRAQLNQLFMHIMHKKYPFDVVNLEIQLRHADIDKNILLVPDFDAYPILQPSNLPGIGKETNITGWRILKSYFGYSTSVPSTNFGLYQYGPFGVYAALQPSKQPLLVFNISAQRHLVESLITELIPLFVIALLLFLLFITDVAQGFANLIVGIGTMFFGTTLAHFQLRQKIPAYQIVYLDSFFLLMYITILVITTISMMHLYKVQWRFIKYHNNLISKLLYWPMLMCSAFALTLWYLYF